MIGDFIKERRKKLNMKQRDLARKIGICTSYIGLVETNKRKIGDRYISDFAKALKCSVVKLREENTIREISEKQLNNLSYLENKIKEINTEIAKEEKKTLRLKKIKEELESKRNEVLSENV